MTLETTLRVIDHGAERLFADRWSCRSFAGDEIDEAALHRILEAARWAPSAYNAQPWRFVWSRRGDEAWQDLLDCLFEANKSWAFRAAALVLVVSKTTLIPPGQTAEVPSPSHSFDAGAAWTNLANQARLSGWSAHAMGGFDRDQARMVARVPAGFSLECMIAVGKRGERTQLPEPLQAIERPNTRLPLSAIAFAGRFGES